jgi:membrane protease YdiL (CAAX protease family)
MFDPPSEESLTPPLAPEPSFGAEPPSAPRRGWTVFAWMVIGAAAALMLLLPGATEKAEGESLGDELGLVMFKLQGRYLVGVSRIMPSPMLYGQARKEFEVGSVGQRQRFVVVAAELAGPKEAHTRLVDLDEEIAEAIEDDFELTDEQREIQRILGKLYPAEDAEDAEAGLTGEDRQTLLDELGWFGTLALTPADSDDQAARDEVLAPAVRTAILLFALVGGIALVGFAGFIGLIIMAVLLFTGRLGSRMRTGQSDHGIYAETFAVWLVGFAGLQIVVSLLATVAPNGIMAANLVAFFASLGALAWPVARGIPWARVRADIGWTVPRGPAVEIGAGLAGYAMAMPIVAIGLLLTFVLMVVQGLLAAADVEPFAPMGGPAHPIILMLSEGGPLMYLQITALGAIAAPIVEETFFRGVLYQHLRNASARGGMFVSIVASTLLSSFIFAAIHPQGWVAIPALGSLATCFALVREWRGSVLGPMIMHGLSNFIVMTVAYNLLSG